MSKKRNVMAMGAAAAALSLMMLAGCSGQQAASAGASSAESAASAQVASAQTQAVSSASAASAPAQTSTSVSSTASASTPAASAPAASASAPAATSAQGSLTEAEAKSIALAHAGVSEADATFTNVYQEVDDGIAKFEVDFIANGKEYDYDIDASTGDILAYDQDIDDQAIAQTSSAGSDIGEQAALDAALAHAGLAANAVTNSYARLETDDGVVKYEVGFRANGQEYDYEIDAQTGNVLSYDVDQDDGDHDNDGHDD